MLITHTRPHTRELVYACVMPLKLCFIGNILLMRNYVYDRTCMWGSKSLPLASRGWFLKIILNKKKNRQRKINTIIDLSVFLFILQHLRRFLAEKKDNIKISEAVIDQTEETEEVRILYHNLWIQDKCLKLKVFLSGSPISSTRLRLVRRPRKE